MADTGTMALALRVTTAVTASDYETMTINSSGGANTITTLTAADVTSLTVMGPRLYYATPLQCYRSRDD